MDASESGNASEVGDEIEGEVSSTCEEAVVRVAGVSEPADGVVAGSSRHATVEDAGGLDEDDDDDEDAVLQDDEDQVVSLGEDLGAIPGLSVSDLGGDEEIISLEDNVLISTTIGDGGYAVLNWGGEEIVEMSSSEGFETAEPDVGGEVSQGGGDSNEVVVAVGDDPPNGEDENEDDDDDDEEEEEDEEEDGDEEDDEMEEVLDEDEEEEEDMARVLSNPHGIPVDVSGSQAQRRRLAGGADSTSGGLRAGLAVTTGDVEVEGGNDDEVTTTEEGECAISSPLSSTSPTSVTTSTALQMPSTSTVTMAVSTNISSPSGVAAVSASVTSPSAGSPVGATSPVAGRGPFSPQNSGISSSGSGNDLSNNRVQRQAAVSPQRTADGVSSSRDKRQMSSPPESGIDTTSASVPSAPNSAGQSSGVSSASDVSGITGDARRTAGVSNSSLSGRAARPGPSSASSSSADDSSMSSEALAMRQEQTSSEPSRPTQVSGAAPSGPSVGAGREALSSSVVSCSTSKLLSSQGLSVQPIHESSKSRVSTSDSSLAPLTKPRPATSSEAATKEASPTSQPPNSGTRQPSSASSLSKQAVATSSSSASSDSANKPTGAVPAAATASASSGKPKQPMANVREPLKHISSTSSSGRSPAAPASSKTQVTASGVASHSSNVALPSGGGSSGKLPPPASSQNVRSTIPPPVVGVKSSTNVSAPVGGAVKPLPTVAQRPPVSSGSAKSSIDAFAVKKPQMLKGVEPSSGVTKTPSVQQVMKSQPQKPATSIALHLSKLSEAHSSNSPISSEPKLLVTQRGSDKAPNSSTSTPQTPVERASGREVESSPGSSSCSGDDEKRKDKAASTSGNNVGCREVEVQQSGTKPEAKASTVRSGPPAKPTPPAKPSTTPLTQTPGSTNQPQKTSTQGKNLKGSSPQVHLSSRKEMEPPKTPVPQSQQSVTIGQASTPSTGKKISQGPATSQITDSTKRSSITPSPKPSLTVAAENPQTSKMTGNEGIILKQVVKEPGPDSKAPLVKTGSSQVGQKPACQTQSMKQSVQPQVPKPSGQSNLPKPPQTSPTQTYLGPSVSQNPSNQRQPQKISQAERNEMQSASELMKPPALPKPIAKSLILPSGDGSRSGNAPTTRQPTSAAGQKSTPEASRGTSPSRRSGSLSPPLQRAMPPEGRPSPSSYQRHPSPASPVTTSSRSVGPNSNQGTESKTQATEKEVASELNTPASADSVRSSAARTDSLKEGREMPENNEKNRLVPEVSSEDSSLNLKDTTEKPSFALGKKSPETQAQRSIPTSMSDNTSSGSQSKPHDTPVKSVPPGTSSECAGTQKAISSGTREQKQQTTHGEPKKGSETIPSKPPISGLPVTKQVSTTQLGTKSAGSASTIPAASASSLKSDVCVVPVAKPVVHPESTSKSSVFTPPTRPQVASSPASKPVPSGTSKSPDTSSSSTKSDAPSTSVIKPSSMPAVPQTSSPRTGATNITGANPLPPTTQAARPPAPGTPAAKQTASGSPVVKSAEIVMPTVKPPIPATATPKPSTPPTPVAAVLKPAASCTPGAKPAAFDSSTTKVPDSSISGTKSATLSTPSKPSVSYPSGAKPTVPGSRGAKPVAPATSLAKPTQPSSVDAKPSVTATPTIKQTVLGTPAAKLTVSGTLGKPPASNVPVSKLNTSSTPVTKGGDPSTPASKPAALEIPVILPGTPGAKSTVPGPIAAKSMVPGTPAAKSTVPGTPAAKPTVPGTPAAKSTVPGTPAAKSTVPGTPAVKPNLPSTPVSKPTVPGSSSAASGSPVSKTATLGAPATKALTPDPSEAKPAAFVAATDKLTVTSSPAVKPSLSGTTGLKPSVPSISMTKPGVLGTQVTKLPVPGTPAAKPAVPDTPGTKPAVSATPTAKSTAPTTPAKSTTLPATVSKQAISVTPAVSAIQAVKQSSAPPEKRGTPCGPTTKPEAHLSSTSVTGRGASQPGTPIAVERKPVVFMSKPSVPGSPTSQHATTGARTDKLPISGNQTSGGAAASYAPKETSASAVSGHSITNLEATGKPVSKSVLFKLEAYVSDTAGQKPVDVGRKSDLSSVVALSHKVPISKPTAPSTQSMKTIPAPTSDPVRKVAIPSSSDTKVAIGDLFFDKSSSLLCPPAEKDTSGDLDAKQSTLDKSSSSSALKVGGSITPHPAADSRPVPLKSEVAGSSAVKSAVGSTVLKEKTVAPLVPIQDKSGADTNLIKKLSSKPLSASSALGAPPVDEVKSHSSSSSIDPTSHSKACIQPSSQESSTTKKDPGEQVLGTSVAGKSSDLKKEKEQAKKSTSEVSKISISQATKQDVSLPSVSPQSASSNISLAQKSEKNLQKNLESTPGGPQHASDKSAFPKPTLVGKEELPESVKKEDESPVSSEKIPAKSGGIETRQPAVKVGAIEKGKSFACISATQKGIVMDSLADTSPVTKKAVSKSVEESEQEKEGDASDVECSRALSSTSVQRPLGGRLGIVGRPPIGHRPSATTSLQASEKSSVTSVATAAMTTAAEESTQVPVHIGEAKKKSVDVGAKIVVPKDSVPPSKESVIEKVRSASSKIAESEQETSGISGLVRKDKHLTESKTLSRPKEVSKSSEVSVKADEKATDAKLPPVTHPKEVKSPAKPSQIVFQKSPATVSAAESSDKPQVAKSEKDKEVDDKPVNIAETRGIRESSEAVAKGLLVIADEGPKHQEVSSSSVSQAGASTSKAPSVKSPLTIKVDDHPLAGPRLSPITLKLVKDSEGKKDEYISLSPKLDSSRETEKLTLKLKRVGSPTVRELESEEKVEKLMLKLKKDPGRSEATVSSTTAAASGSVLETTPKTSEDSEPKVGKLMLKLTDTDKGIVARISKGASGDGQKSETEEDPKVEKLTLKLKKDPSESGLHSPCASSKPDDTPKVEKLTLKLSRVDSPQEVTEVEEPRVEKLMLKLKKDGTEMHSPKEKMSLDSQLSPKPEKITLRLRKDSGSTEGGEKKVEHATEGDSSERIKLTLVKDSSNSVSVKEKDTGESETVSLKDESKVEKITLKLKKDVEKPVSIGPERAEPKVEKLTLKLKSGGDDMSGVKDDSKESVEKVSLKAKDSEVKVEEQKVEKLTLKLKKDEARDVAESSDITQVLEKASEPSSSGGDKSVSAHLSAGDAAAVDSKLTLKLSKSAAWAVKSPPPSSSYPSADGGATAAASVEGPSRRDSSSSSASAGDAHQGREVGSPPPTKRLRASSSDAAASSPLQRAHPHHHPHHRHREEMLARLPTTEVSVSLKRHEPHSSGATVQGTVAASAGGVSPSKKSKVEDKLAECTVVVQEVSLPHSAKSPRLRSPPPVSITKSPSSPTKPHPSSSPSPKSPPPHPPQQRAMDGKLREILSKIGGKASALLDCDVSISFASDKGAAAAAVAAAAAGASGSGSGAGVATVAPASGERPDHRRERGDSVSAGGGGSSSGGGAGGSVAAQGQSEEVEIIMVPGGGGGGSGVSVSRGRGRPRGRPSLHSQRGAHHPQVYRGPSPSSQSGASPQELVVEPDIINIEPVITLDTGEGGGSPCAGSVGSPPPGGMAVPRRKSRGRPRKSDMPSRPIPPALAALSPAAAAAAAALTSQLEVKVVPLTLPSMISSAPGIHRGPLPPGAPMPPMHPMRPKRPCRGRERPFVEPKKPRGGGASRGRGARKKDSPGGTPPPPGSGGGGPLSLITGGGESEADALAVAAAAAAMRARAAKAVAEAAKAAAEAAVLASAEAALAAAAPPDAATGAPQVSVFAVPSQSSSSSPSAHVPSQPAIPGLLPVREALSALGASAGGAEMRQSVHPSIQAIVGSSSPSTALSPSHSSIASPGGAVSSPSSSAGAAAKVGSARGGGSTPRKPSAAALRKARATAANAARIQAMAAARAAEQLQREKDALASKGLPLGARPSDSVLDVEPTTPGSRFFPVASSSPLTVFGKASSTSTGDSSDLLKDGGEDGLQSGSTTTTIASPAAQVVLLDEETRMSADISITEGIAEGDSQPPTPTSHSQLPAAATVSAEPAPAGRDATAMDVEEIPEGDGSRVNNTVGTPAPAQVPVGGEESQGSGVSSATGDSGTPSVRKKVCRMEVCDPDAKEFTVDMLAEYQWPPGRSGEPFMLQEQVAEYLGVKSFKRKYPDLQRRVVEAEEKTYLREKGLVSDNLSDMGLTAINSVEVLDIMFADFPEKYEEYRRHLRERQAKEMSLKQKLIAVTSNAERSRLDYKERATSSAASWNAKFNRARREQRRACFDLQNLTVHFPASRIKKMTREVPKLGHYPIALIPGQYTDYYKEYTPPELRYFPLNTVLYGPMKPNERQEAVAGSEGSQSDSDDSSSSDESSSSSSSEGTQDTEETGSTAGDTENVEGPVGGGPSKDSLGNGLTNDSSQNSMQVNGRASVITGGNSSERPVKDEASAICKICGGDRNRNKESKAEVLIHCGTCTSSCHPSCLDLTLDMVPHIRKYNWQCTDCKTCIQCKDPADEDKMLFCDMCDRGYHIYCVGLRRVPSGRWHCRECAVCGSCGSREPGPGPDAQWQHEVGRPIIGTTTTTAAGDGPGHNSRPSCSSSSAAMPPPRPRSFRSPRGGGGLLHHPRARPRLRGAVGCVHAVAGSSGVVVVDGGGGDSLRGRGGGRRRGLSLRGKIGGMSRGRGIAVSSSTTTAATTSLSPSPSTSSLRGGGRGGLHSLRRSRGFFSLRSRSLFSLRGRSRGLVSLRGRGLLASLRSRGLLTLRRGLRGGVALSLRGRGGGSGRGRASSVRGRGRGRGRGRPRGAGAGAEMGAGDAGVRGRRGIGGTSMRGRGRGRRRGLGARGAALLAARAVVQSAVAAARAAGRPRGRPRGRPSLKHKVGGWLSRGVVVKRSVGRPRGRPPGSRRRGRPRGRPRGSTKAGSGRNSNDTSTADAPSSSSSSSTTTTTTAAAAAVTTTTTSSTVTSSFSTITTTTDTATVVPPDDVASASATATATTSMESVSSSISSTTPVLTSNSSSTSTVVALAASTAETGDGEREMDREGERVGEDAGGAEEEAAAAAASAAAASAAVVVAAAAAKAEAEVEATVTSAAAPTASVLSSAPTAEIPV